MLHLFTDNVALLVRQSFYQFLAIEFLSNCRKIRTSSKSLSSMNSGGKAPPMASSKSFMKKGSENWYSRRSVASDRRMA